MLETGYGNSLRVRLHYRTNDPPTSKAAARKAVESLRPSAKLAAEIVQRYSKPGTTWEMAHFAQCADIEGTEKLNTTELHFMLARRLPDAERYGLVTCDRIHGEGGETIRTATKVCEIKGTQQIAWRAMQP